MTDRDASQFACSICSRPLNRAEDPLSENCGGDCLGCIVAAEDGKPAPDLPVAELRTWLAARDARMAALWQAATLRDGQGGAS